MNISTLLDLITPTVFGFLGTLGFAILFSVPRRTLLLSSLVGALGAFVRAFLLKLGASPELSVYVASLVVGLVGYGAAFVIESPRLIYTVPGVITMVPGILAYEMIVYFSSARYNEGLVSGIKATLIAGAIAAGLVTARILTEIDLRRPQHGD